VGLKILNHSDVVEKLIVYNRVDAFKQSVSSSYVHAAHPAPRRRYASGRTSGIPTLCCREGRPDESSANERCSESETRGCTLPKLRCTLHW